MSVHFVLDPACGPAAAGLQTLACERMRATILEAFSFLPIRLWHAERSRRYELREDRLHGTDITSFFGFMLLIVIVDAVVDDIRLDDRLLLLRWSSRRH